MQKTDQYKKLMRIVTGVIILAIHCAIFTYVWYDYYRPYLKRPFWRRGDWAVIGIYVLLVYLFTKIYGGFKVGYARTMDILYSHIISLLCSNVFLYFQICVVARDYLNPIKILQMTFFQGIAIVIWAVLVKYTYAKIYPPRNMLLIYGETLPTEFINKINARRDRYNICDQVHVSEGIGRIIYMMEKYDAVIICECRSSVRNVIMKYCYAKGIRAYMVPKVSDILIMGAEDMHIFDTPLLLSRNQGLSGDELFIKRAIDIVVSLIGIILSSPIMIVEALAIKLYDRGPAIYKQERLTIGGKTFNVLKFRSMCVDSEVDGVQLAKKHDDRITPVGKVIRNLHFDELPQLFNVLKGDMSMVGPRPERPEVAETYKELIPEFDFRLKVKAGLTGYAQIYGKYNTTPRDKLKLDMAYIQKYTVWLDIKMMLLTAKIIFQKETSEGVEDDQTTAIREREE